MEDKETFTIGRTRQIRRSICNNLCQCLTIRRNQRRLRFQVRIRGSRSRRRGSAFFVRPFRTIMKRLILITLVTLTTICLGHHIFAQGVVCVSNLGHAWTQPGIGAIQGLFRGGTPYGSDTAYFTTGAGNFSVDAITLEFFFDPSITSPSAPQWVSIQLFQQTGGENVLLGTFGNPVVDPTPTPWPESANPRDYTTYYDFSSLEPINVNPFSQYSVVLSMPTNSPVDAALLFTISSYT